MLFADGSACLCCVVLCCFLRRRLQWSVAFSCKWGARASTTASMVRGGSLRSVFQDSVFSVRACVCSLIGSLCLLCFWYTLRPLPLSRPSMVFAVVAVHAGLRSAELREHLDNRWKLVRCLPTCRSHALFHYLAFSLLLSSACAAAKTAAAAATAAAATPHAGAAAGAAATSAAALLLFTLLLLIHSIWTHPLALSLD